MRIIHGVYNPPTFRDLAEVRMPVILVGSIPIVAHKKYDHRHIIIIIIISISIIIIIISILGVRAGYVLLVFVIGSSARTPCDSPSVFSCSLRVLFLCESSNQRFLVSATGFEAWLWSRRDNMR